MSKVKKLASQTAVYGISYMAGRLFNFLLTPIYTRFFTQVDYGYMSLAYAYLTLLSIIWLYGMETGYFYYSNRLKGAQTWVAGTAFTSVGISSVILSGAMVAFAHPIAVAVGLGDHVGIVRIGGLILLVEALAAIPFAWLRKREQAMRFAGLKMGNVLMNIALNAIFLFGFQGTKLWNWIGGGVEMVLLSNLIASSITLLLLVPEIREWRLRVDKLLWKPLMRYSLPLIIIGLAGMVNETFDRVMLRRLLPGSMDEKMYQVGIYSAAYKLSIFMTLAVSSFRFAAEPFFFSQMRAKGVKELYARVINYFAFIVGLIFIGIMAAMPLLKHLIGPHFREGLDVVPILLIANMMLGVYYYLSQWYKQSNNTRYGALVSGIGAGLTILFNWILIPKMGFYGSAWATLICYLSMVLISFIWGQKVWPVKYDVGRLSLYLGLPIITYQLSLITDSATMKQLLLIVLGMGYIYLFLRLEKIPLATLPQAVKNLKPRRK